MRVRFTGSASGACGLRSNGEEEKGRLSSSPFVGRDNIILYQKVFNK
jgi:hypothetical protein